MAVVRNILVRVGADIRGYQTNMAQAQRSTQMSMRSIAGSLAVGRVALVALGAAAVAAFAIVSKNAIKAAMDVVESESLFTVSMGSMGAAARAWSEDLQASLGLNAYEIRRSVGVFYNMTTSMGLARKEAYKLSTELTELAYDMASFYNMPVEEMLIKLQSGITGETEPLKRIGILVLDNVIKQYAYAEGIANVGDELTEQQKVMARYIAIMAQTRNAQGDLARTIMSPTNQLRILKMQLQLASINLGNAFMPIVTIVLPILTNFAKSLVRVTNTFAQFMRALFGSNNAQTQNAQSAADAAAAQGKLGNATKKAGDKAKKGVAGFDEINELQEDMAANAADAADAMDDGTGTMPAPSKPDSETSMIPQGVLDMAARAREVLAPIGTYISEIGGMFKKFWADIQPSLQPTIDFIKKVFAPVWEGLGVILTVAFDTIKKVIGGALQVIKGIIEVFAGFLTGDWAMMWQGIKDIASGAWTIIKAVFTGAWNILKAEWNILTSTLKIVWETAWNAIKNFASAIWNGISALATTIWTSISTFFSTLWDGIKLKSSTIWEGIKLALSNAWNWIKTTATAIWNPISTFFSTLWDGIKIKSSTIWEGIKSSLSGVWNWISTKASEAFGAIKNTIINAFTTVGEVVKGIWDGIKTSIKGSINFIIETINSFITKINSIKIKIPSVDIPGVGTIGGGTIKFPQIPEIPQLAKGGEIAKPTLAVMGERKKREAVIPLEDSSVWDMMASTVGTAVLNAMQFAQPQQGGQSQQGQAVFNLDGDQFARAVTPLIIKEQGRIGTMAIQGAGL